MMLLLVVVLAVQVQQLQPGLWQFEAPLQLSQQFDGAVRMALPADAGIMF
jgi:hypothetical protein